MPLVGLILDVKKEHLFDLKGIFLLNEEHPELTIEDECLHVLFEFKTEIHYDIVNKLFENSYVIKQYPIDSFNYLYIIRVPIAYSHEYNCFIQSKYSEYSEEYKKQIIRFHKYTKDNAGSQIIQILYKDEKAYRQKEEFINKGLPLKEWTMIPRGQEIGARWDENSETVQLETLTKEKLKS